jgi:signal transduction histidine kinase
VLASAVGADALAWMTGSPAQRAYAASCAFIGFAGLGLFYSGKRIQEEREWRAAWILLAAFLALIVLLGCLQVRDILTEGPHAVFSLTTGSLFQWMGCFCLLIPTSLGFTRRLNRSWLELLDGGIFAVALYLCLWIWVVKGILPETHGDSTQQVTLQATFVVISVGAGVATHAWASLGFRLRHPQGMLAIGLLCFITAGIWRVQVDLSGAFTYAHPVRLAMLPSIVFFWLATRQPMSHPRLGRARLALLMALPYIPAAIAFPVAMAAYLPRSGARDPMGFLLMGLLTLLLLIRQAIALRQIEHMNQVLEQRVQERTQALARSQAVVLRTQQMNLLATLGAGMTHDLNNLLTSAMGHLDMSREARPSDSGQAGEHLDQVQSSLTMACGLTRRIMALGHGEREGTLLLDLGQHLAQLEPVLRAILPKTLDLHIQTAGRGPCLVMASQAYLDQIIVNLVMNARDATPPGGSIRVETLRGEDGATILEVEDSGSGIPDAVMARIFEPFFTTKPAGQGTGLGLGSVKAVVSELGGTLSVDSEVSRGSRFMIRFPGIEGFLAEAPRGA